MPWQLKFPYTSIGSCNNSLVKPQAWEPLLRQISSLALGTECRFLFTFFSTCSSATRFRCVFFVWLVFIFKWQSDTGCVVFCSIGCICTSSVYPQRALGMMLLASGPVGTIRMCLAEAFCFMTITVLSLKQSSKLVYCLLVYCCKTAAAETSMQTSISQAFMELGCIIPPLC